MLCGLKAEERKKKTQNKKRTILGCLHRHESLNAENKPNSQINGDSKPLETQDGTLL
jgi:hypothetical protein